MRADASSETVEESMMIWGTSPSPSAVSSPPSPLITASRSLSAETMMNDDVPVGEVGRAVDDLGAVDSARLSAFALVRL